MEENASKPNIARKLWTLFRSTFQLSACTFGGGFVIVPLMRQKFVKELHWIDEEEMLDLTAIAQSSPGAIAVNASIIVGYRVAGVPGALISTLGAILPPLIIITILSKIYEAVKDNALVSAIMTAMLAGVAAVIFDVVVKLFSDIIKKKRVLPLLVLAASFAAVRFFKVSVAYIILACALIGAADTLYQSRRGVSKQ